MPRVVLVVEGIGDVEALPSLVSRVGVQFGLDIIAAHPVRAGGAHKLRQPGQLERFAMMAASRDNIDAVIVAIDLDDDCAAEMHTEFLHRCGDASAKFNVPFRICFCVREFECWMLHDLENLKINCPEYDWDPHFRCEYPEKVRGAKELIRKAIRQNYRETIDQLRISRRIDIKSVFSKSRFFQKFIKSVTDLDYDQLHKMTSTG